MKKLSMEELERLSVQEFKETKKSPLVLVLDNVRSLNNVGWSGKIGLTGTKANDVFALRFEGFRLRVDGKGG